MTCFFCKGTTENDLTTHVVNIKNSIIIVKNVPCLKCAQCGETFFTNDVIEQLDEIVALARNTTTEVAIVNYSNYAA